MDILQNSFAFIRYFVVKKMQKKKRKQTSRSHNPTGKTNRCNASEVKLLPFKADKNEMKTESMSLAVRRWSLFSANNI